MVIELGGVLVTMNKRVKIIGNHPWVGETGILADIEITPVGKAYVIQLDCGVKCMVFHNQNLKYI
jgi:hypothetical protein